MIICCLQLWIFQPVKTADTSWCHPGFPMKWHLRNKRRNSILMTYHYPDLGSASDWLRQVSLAAWLIRSTTQIKVKTSHQERNSALVPQTSFCKENSSCIAKWLLFPQAMNIILTHNVKTTSDVLKDLLQPCVWLKVAHKNLGDLMARLENIHSQWNQTIMFGQDHLNKSLIT